ncbi:hypothetical protein L873DRAFT_1792970 [Choiromyces venosus 120613-1]|uniref:Uncharacterized protein n=1 Tax=Choiromyces venosus 120613-1 TaxID=1336337 RepID=A0A3N4J8L5_9PEZI|nr:hypothetical protein L873DRAFT_1792970 [Choiromyces venosus 120613-1]
MIVMRMLKLYTAQSLKVLCAEENKLAKRQGEKEGKGDQERAKLDQENILLLMLKKRTFREAAAALTNSDDTDTERKKVENARERKRKLRDHGIALNEKYVKQGDSLVEAVQCMSQAFDLQDIQQDDGRMTELEKESEIIHKEVAELKETVQDTSSKVNRILELLLNK